MNTLLGKQHTYAIRSWDSPSRLIPMTAPLDFYDLQTRADAFNITIQIVLGSPNAALYEGLAANGKGILNPAAGQAKKPQKPHPDRSISVPRLYF